MAVGSFNTGVGKEFYEEVHGHRLSRTRDLSDLCHGT